MPSSAYTSAGSTLLVSEDTPSINTVADFDLLDFVEVGEVTDLGQFGASDDVLSYYEARSNNPSKLVGNRSYGSLNITMAAVRADDGQAIIQQARRGRQRCSFQITTPEPDAYYFTGIVSGYQVSVGGSDQIVSATITVELDSEFVVDEDIVI